MGREKLFVPPGKRAKIKDICARRNQGEFGDPAIKDDLLQFIKTDLKEKFFEPGLRTRIGEDAFEKRKQSYAAYENFIKRVSVSTITRALSNTGVTRSAIHLIELFDLYIEAYDPEPKPAPEPLGIAFQGSDGFSFNTIYHLKERAINRCSFPRCPIPTSGPVLRDGALSRNLGKAVWIYGVHPGDARYDAANPQQEDDIHNAIWLCALHAGLVNEHSGKDYSPKTLLKWKRAHEQMMNAWVEGRKIPYFQLNFNEPNPALVAGIISFFDNQAALFELLTINERSRATSMTGSIRMFFEDRSDDIRDNDTLLQQVYIIELAIDIFAAETNNTEDDEVFTSSFAALQKLIGIVLAEMAAINKLQLPGNLIQIAPANP